MVAVERITAVKTDYSGPPLQTTARMSETVVQFYEELEDVCGFANNCKGMNYRELLALRARCRGSRLKTFTNVHKAAFKTGEVTDNPQAVYERIKQRHLVFTESREEKEMRVDAEHVALMKGRLTGHVEPLAELESVGLGKTARFAASPERDPQRLSACGRVTAQARSVVLLLGR